jgi:hypothetical protein
MAFWRGVQCPRRRPAVVVVNAYLMAHLYHAIPNRWDPLRVLADPARIGGHG